MNIREVLSVIGFFKLSNAEKQKNPIDLQKIVEQTNEELAEEAQITDPERLKLLFQSLHLSREAEEYPSIFANGHYFLKLLKLANSEQPLIDWIEQANQRYACAFQSGFVGVQTGTFKKEKNSHIECVHQAIRSLEVGESLLTYEMLHFNYGYHQIGVIYSRLKEHKVSITFIDPAGELAKHIGSDPKTEIKAGREQIHPFVTIGPFDLTHLTSSSWVGNLFEATHDLRTFKDKRELLSRISKWLNISSLKKYVEPSPDYRFAVQIGNSCTFKVISLAIKWWAARKGGKKAAREMMFDLKEKSMEDAPHLVTDAVRKEYEKRCRKWKQPGVIG